MSLLDGTVPGSEGRSHADIVAERWADRTRFVMVPMPIPYALDYLQTSTQDLQILTSDGFLSESMVLDSTQSEVRVIILAGQQAEVERIQKEEAAAEKVKKADAAKAKKQAEKASKPPKAGSTKKASARRGRSKSPAKPSKVPSAESPEVAVSEPVSAEA